MPVAISVKAANATASRMVALWEEAGRFEEQPSMRALGYPPHITLAVYENIEPDEVVFAVDTVFRDVSAYRISFGRLDHFEGSPLVLWAAPSACAALDQAHGALHKLIDPALCRPHYRPGAWVPHCSLATQVKSELRDEAVSFVSRPIPAFEVIFDVADCVSFPPVAIVKEFALSSA